MKVEFFQSCYHEL